ncbi:MAG: saccharopine dehydrogenase NADP-binding domain-containing protein [Thermoflexales bacterium]|nr:saccharopine dehydrogenase NADP-binding domain-containing protein [Thermoflexales bacterium]
MKIPFGGRILVLGCGAVSQCLQPLLIRHLDMDFRRITVMDFEDMRHTIPDSLAAGVNYAQEYVTPRNMAMLLEKYVGPGDLLVDVAWNIDSGEIIQWCHDHQVMYINTSVELWDPYTENETRPPTERTLYVRHMELRKRARSWATPGPTALVEHGANPGLVSHWVKIALEDVAKAILQNRTSREREDLLEQYLADADYPRLAMLTGTKVIHISERDTQISNRPKEVDEFVNTWSVAGFHEEGIAPAELGWGTHERRLPMGAQVHRYGPGNQICLSQMGVNTLVRSWVPTYGEIVGMVIRHGEAFTMGDFLTVWQDDKPVYRPTVHYAYQPSDAAVASLLELRGRNYQLQPRVRIMNDDIVSGRDELGVLLMGHDMTSWWVGSQLDIREARSLVPHQSATTLQVAASILGALAWMIRNPERGFVVPDQLPHREVLQVAQQYLGPTPSIRSDWTPLKNRHEPFENWGRGRPNDDDTWQFASFRV